MKPLRVSLVAALAVGLIGTAAAQTAAEAAAAARLPPVRAPHYGDTLFHFYQDAHFRAITSLMVSQHFGRLQPHDGEAEVLRGGLMLSYGLHAQAAEVFTQLIERNASVAVRDRAWFFLARIRHQRGLPEQAQAALGRISAPLKGTLEEDRQLLRAQLLMARQDYAGAAAVLDALKGSTSAGLYARFNLGVALIKTGRAANVERGTLLLAEVGQAPGADEESRSLRDRANVALGFVALQNKHPREARTALQRVRLTGAQSNKALLGYGWAAAELNDPKLALVPWTELATRNITDASVLEAHIAVPYAMGELGAYSQALQGYQSAVAVFEREKQGLDESVAAIRAGKLVQGLLQHNPGSGLGAFARMGTLPEMPHAAHLVPLLADNPFQETFKHLRDLQFLRDNLGQWQANLGTYTDMLDNRRSAFATRLPAVRARSGAVDLPALQQRSDTLGAELAQADEGNDATVFATPRERELLERARRVRATLARLAGQGGTAGPGLAVAPDLAAAPDLAVAAERLRRVQGALTWQQSQEFSARRWAARKAFAETEAALSQARLRDAALLRAQRDEAARHQRFATRIAALGVRLQALQPQVAVLDALAQGQLQQIAVAELEAQQGRLDLYAAQAGMAIAQILDRAQLVQRNDRATPSPAGSEP